ncbi:MAG: ABC transporter permease [Actinobacteria bacterium]|nr:ABC transporter permease [Actinomycetota bacterium]
MTAAVAAPQKPRRQYVWAAFAAPGVGWLIAFFVVSVYAVMAVAFGAVDPLLKTPIPAWNPLQWDTTAMGNVLDRVFGGDLGHVFIRTFSFVGAALAGCILIGYPVAYYVARKANRWRGLLLGLLVLPFWISYLMRMLAWTNLLQLDGYVNRVLQFLHIQNDPRNWLDGDWSTVVIGLIYGYLPFFILPLYSTLERIDGRLIEAGRDLGANAVHTFLRVTLPLSVPGMMAASVITILPMFGDYYTNTYLTSGSPRTEMVGNQIEYYLRGSSQPQTGASLVLVLMAFLFVLMVYYLVTTIREQRRSER